MLIVIDKPVGIHAAITKLQGKLDSSLTTKWNLTSDQYMCYGLASRNKTDKGFVAEVFTQGNDYRDVYWDDAKSAVSFFTPPEKITQEKGQAKCTVGLVFFVDLKKLKPSISHRADEEVRQDVIKLIGYSSFSCSLQSVEMGIDNVLREFPVSKNGLYAVDMQPTCAFRINLNIIYQNN